MGKIDLAKVRQPKVAAPKTAVNTPEHTEAMSRVKKLTQLPSLIGNPDPSMQEVGMHYVRDVMSHGVNALEDRGDVSNEVTSRLHGKLHQVGLHLDRHYSAHNKNNHAVAAAHLELAAKHLNEVGSTLSNNLGKSVTHFGDKQSYPISFLKMHVNDLTNHYRKEVAGIQGSTALIKNADYYTPDTYKVVDEKSKPKSEWGNPIPSGTATPPKAGNVVRRVGYSSNAYFPHTLESGPNKNSPRSSGALGPDRTRSNVGSRQPRKKS